jgi:hypothetical protein
MACDRSSVAAENGCILVDLVAKRDGIGFTDVGHHRGFPS